MPVAQAVGAVARGRNEGARNVEVDVVGNDEITTLLDRLADASGPIELREPEGFVGELRNYQARGVGWLSHLEASGFGGCLADDMGLGKTIMVIALALHDPRTTLVVCPTSVIGNWEREIARFAPKISVVRHHGTERAEDRRVDAAKRSTEPGTIVLTSYGLMRRDRALLSGIEWGRVVLDEAQNIKNPVAQQTRAARSLHARSRLALTGTPVENRLTDLWSIMQFCNPGLLGTSEDFAERFAGPIERGDAEGDRAAAAHRPAVRAAPREVRPGRRTGPPARRSSRPSSRRSRPSRRRCIAPPSTRCSTESQSAQGMARRGKILALDHRRSSRSATTRPSS